jgi:hypothetical protein
MSTSIFDLSSALPELDDYIPFGDVSSGQPSKCTIGEVIETGQREEVLVTLSQGVLEIDIQCPETTQDILILFDASNVDPDIDDDFDVNLTLPQSARDQQKITFSLYASYFQNVDLSDLEVEIYFPEYTTDWVFGTTVEIDTRNDVTCTIMYNVDTGKWMKFSFC